MGKIGQLLVRGFEGGVVFAAACTGFVGFLCLLYQLLSLTRPKEVRLAEKRIESHRLYLVSGRGRIAYLILCLEEALRFYKQDGSAWEWILRRLWSITDCSDSNWMNIWIGSVEKLLPSTVLGNTTADVPTAETSQARTLYTQAGTAMIVIHTIMENAFSIVCDWDPSTEAWDPDAIGLIEKTEETMELFGVPLPSDEVIRPLLKQKDAYLGEPFDGWRCSRIFGQE